MQKVYLKFKQTREVQDGSGTVFEAGKTYSFTDQSSVDHWLNRGVAEKVSAPKKAVEKKTESKQQADEKDKNETDRTTENKDAEKD